VPVVPVNGGLGSDAEGRFLVAGTAENGQFEVHRLVESTWEQVGDSWDGPAPSLFSGRIAALPPDWLALPTGMSVRRFDGEEWEDLGPVDPESAAFATAAF